MQNTSPATKPFTLRLPVEMKQALEAKAKSSRRTVSSLILEGVETVLDTQGAPKRKLSLSEFIEKYAGVGRVGEGLDEKGMAERMQLIRGDD